MSQTDDRCDAFGDRLGMHEPISRRDFINGALVAGAGAWLGGRVPNEATNGSGSGTHG